MRKTIKFIGQGVFLAFLVSMVGLVVIRPVFSSSNHVTIKMTASVVKKVEQNGKMTFTGGWSPRVIKVNQGDDVTLVITSIDADHNLVIDDFHVNQFIPSGQTVTINFTANKPGNFGFHCGSLGSCGAMHTKMIGMILVNSPGQADSTK